MSDRGGTDDRSDAGRNREPLSLLRDAVGIAAIARDGATREARLLKVPGEGALLVRVDWLSLDPYMRGRMNEGKSYAARVELGEVMVGGTVGTVVASRHSKFAEGEKVLGTLGWQRFAVSDGKGLVKLPDPRLPETVWLGAAGMPGITAWMGLPQIAQPKAGETLCVSAASGAVGSVVGSTHRSFGARDPGENRGLVSGGR